MQISLILKLYSKELNKIGLFKIDINFHSEVSANIIIKIDKIKKRNNFSTAVKN